MTTASDLEIADLQARFTKAITSLDNDVGRLLEHIATHPRYNEKLDRVRVLLERLETAVGCARSMVSAQVSTGDHIGKLAELVQAISERAKELADENALHPASKIGILPASKAENEV